ncbi:thiamine pyrophosphate-binding protein [Sphingomonas sp. BT-65]|uniref:thiamine pyrophosphate-binding protein n=1 Tax=Sphingomonas sp. BT-65 TaxID=2989821 RepID=UPI0022366871|nr:thiamine pyrophosphate-binding protein [Sphingomonas sp. BT-65]MCW4460631.1 thiamine pyrophosphate-binding protein [Sphingomonas sp. BT-65]
MTNFRNGGRILVDNLVVQGCDRIFHVPGESFLAVLDALHDTPQVDLVTCRQEGGAAFMACADGTMTGKPGVCFVTRGPGATNASIGVHVAMQDSQPMLLFIGDVDRSMRDREGFQEVDFPAMFAPLAKWATRIEDARRIPEYIARAWNVATSGRPGPVVIALPEDMLLDEVEAVDRPRLERIAQAPDADALASLGELLSRAENPIAIVGGAGWSQASGAAFAAWAEKLDLPVASAFRRQDALPSGCGVYAGNLGYGPSPRLVERVRNADLILAVGARLGEATTDGYTLIAPDPDAGATIIERLPGAVAIAPADPGRKLVHIHPDPNELHRVYRTDLAICADMNQFAAALDEVPVDRLFAGSMANEEWRTWSTPQPREGVTLDLGQCVAAMRERLGPDEAIICNGAGNFSGWWHRYWHYGTQPSQLAPTAGAMGYGTPAAVAAALRHPEKLAVALAGDGDFLMNGQELATAIQHGANMLVLVIDNGAYGTIRMHQEREFPARLSGTTLHNPDFAALGRAYGCWAETVERTPDFAPALDRALAQSGVRLLHLKTDVEFITPGTTISAIRG